MVQSLLFKKVFVPLVSGVLLCYTALGMADKVAGKAIVVRGDVQAISAGNEARKLERRSDFFTGDTIVTGENSKAQIRFSDDTMVSIEPNTRYKVESYNFKSAGQPDNKSSLISGGLRVITGAVAKKDPDAYRVKTPVATIGVRGTDFSTTASADGQSGTLVVNQGRVIAEAGGQTFDISAGQMNNALDISPAGAIQVPASEVSKSDSSAASVSGGDSIGSRSSTDPISPINSTTSAASSPTVFQPQGDTVVFVAFNLPSSGVAFAGFGGAVSLGVNGQRIEVLKNPNPTVVGNTEGNFPGGNGEVLYTITNPSLEATPNTNLSPQDFNRDQAIVRGIPAPGSSNSWGRWMAPTNGGSNNIAVTGPGINVSGVDSGGVVFMTATMPEPSAILALVNSTSGTNPAATWTFANRPGEVVAVFSNETNGDAIKPYSFNAQFKLNGTSLSLNEMKVQAYSGGEQWKFAGNGTVETNLSNTGVIRGFTGAVQFAAAGSNVFGTVPGGLDAAGVESAFVNGSSLDLGGSFGAINVGGSKFMGGVFLIKKD